MFSPRILLLCALVAGLLALPQPAAGQGFDRFAQERAAEHRRRFVQGLEALEARELELAEALFLECLRLRSDDAIAYYNLACVYALVGRVQPAVECLRSCFDRGYQDLAHIERDLDLDGIRRTPAFRKAWSEMEEAVLRGVRPAEAWAPEAKEPFPVLVTIHDERAQPSKILASLQQVLPQWGHVVPVGPIYDDRLGDLSGYFWDQRLEFLVAREVSRYLDAHPRADRRRVYVAGEGASGALALNLLVHRPELFSGVLASGPRLVAGLDGIRPEGVRAYLIAQPGNDEAVRAAELARDGFVAGGSPVVLERYRAGRPQTAPFSDDRALLYRALSWLQGQETRLPGAGGKRSF